MQTLPEYTKELRSLRHAKTFVDHVRGLALHRWSDGPLETRASVPLTDDPTLHDAAVEYTKFIQKKTVLGQLREAALVVPPHTPIADLDEASITGGFVKPGNAIPLAHAPVTDFYTESTELATLIALDRRVVEQTPNVFERVIAAALRGLEDKEFLSATAAIANTRPGGILAGLSPIGTAATGLAEKIAAVAAAVSNGNARALYLILSPANAVALGAANGGISGGAIAGVPIVTSPAAGVNVIGVDAAKLVISDQAIEVTRSESAGIEFSDAPVGSSTVPTGAPALISAYQTNIVVLKCRRTIFWRLTAVNAAAYAVMS